MSRVCVREREIRNGALADGIMGKFFLGDYRTLGAEPGRVRERGR